MKTLLEVQSEYLQKALSRPVAPYGIKINGRFRNLANYQSLYPERCPEAVTALIESRYVNGNTVQDEVPLEIIEGAPEDFLGGAKKVLAFVSPDLGEDNLKVEILDSLEDGKLKVRFPANHNFAVQTQKIEGELFKSTIDGKYYLEDDLPENDDEKVTAKFSQAVKTERNARISDTDKYAEIPDMTVKVSEDEPRRALTEEERAEVLAYRTALRDFPEAEGFPFIDFPEIPSCIAIECSEPIKARKILKELKE